MPVAACVRLSQAARGRGDMQKAARSSGTELRGLYGVQSVSGVSEQLGAGVHLLLHRLDLSR